MIPNTLRRIFLLTLMVTMVGFYPINSFSKDTPQELEDYFVTASQKVSPSIVKITVNRPPVWRGKPIPLPRMYKEQKQNGKGNEYYFEMDTSYWDQMQIEPKLRELLPKNFNIPFRVNQQGTGMIISPDGYILTAYHTVKDARSIQVQAQDLSMRGMGPRKKNPYNAELVGYDTDLDIALIKINGIGLPSVDFGESKPLQVGQWAIGVGYPTDVKEESNTPSITVGHIGGLNRSLPEITSAPLIQLDAQIGTGYGGGPVVNMQGQVIGMIVAKSNESDSGIGFAIPIDKIKPAIKDLRSQKVAHPGWLGVGISDITNREKDRLNLPDNKGALVTRVYQGSPADKAGFRVDDAIIRYGDKEVPNAGQLRDYVSDTPSGERVVVHVLRKGNRISLTVRIEPKEDEYL